ncbi:unnamed protein product, partial [marine sediment metagenome]
SLNDTEKYDAIILSGSYDFLPTEEDFSKEIKLIKEYSKPILGICFGFQLICYAYGSKLEKLYAEEKGILHIDITIPDKIFDGLNSLKVFENHRWYIKEIKTLIPLAKSKDGIEAIKHPEKKIYGFQFHPESFIKKTDGKRLIRNFLELCQDK